MSFTSKGVLPEDDNGKPVLGLWDDATSTVIPVHIKSKVTGADGKQYAILDINVSNANANGQTTMSASAPVVLPSDQTAIPVGRVAGTAWSANAGTVDANSQRVVQGGAATGTKTSVASSASSVTILASNTSRKGATLYNDSTQICYVDLSGGTASNSSYSLQMPANSFFEVPGPTLYNGAITGIWAAANGNMRVTEWS